MDNKRIFRNGLPQVMKATLGIGILGAVLWIDPPTPTKLRVNPNPPMPDFREPEPGIVKLRLQAWNRNTQSWNDFTIAINTAKRRLAPGSSAQIGRSSTGDSGDIGIFLLSLPLMVPLFPLLVGADGILAALERVRGMSRHSHWVVRELRGQLDKETLNLLAETFKNEWNSHRKLTQSVSFADAQKLLRTCDLVESFNENDEAQGPWRVYEWTDAEGDVVAQGERGDRRDRTVAVLGSRFIGDDADELSDCYASRELRDYARSND